MVTLAPIPAPAPLDRPEEWLVSSVDDVVLVVDMTDGDREAEEVVEDEGTVVDASIKSVDWYLILIP